MNQRNTAVSLGVSSLVHSFMAHKIPSSYVADIKVLNEYCGKEIEVDAAKDKGVVVLKKGTLDLKKSCFVTLAAKEDKRYLHLRFLV